MAIPRSYIEANINRVFIAYSYVHVELAIEELERVPNAEAVVLQPYEKNRRFSSTKETVKETVDFYRTLRDGQGVPILFTPHGRQANEGQFFEYGARLLDVLDITAGGARETVEQNQQLGKWVLQHDDDLYSAKNLLVVRAPIVPLIEKLPINVGINILRPNRGGRVEAVSIPAPKLIDKEYVGVLQSL